MDNLFPNMTFGAPSPTKKEAEKAKKELSDKVAKATENKK